MSLATTISLLCSSGAGELAERLQDDGSSLNVAVSTWTDSSLHSTGAGTSSEATKTADSWTFLVYLDGDNNLESAAILDFLEMASVGSTSQVNIIVQFDRAPYSGQQGYSSAYGDWSGTKRYRITRDMEPTAANALTDLGELDMGAPATLTDFVVWGINSYPATHYILVLWDHGGGWNGAVCWDDSSADDALTMAELSSALSDAKTSTGTTLSIIALDACLMAMVENVYQLRSLSEVLVSSEETIPGYGFPYDDILADLQSNVAIIPTDYAIDIVSRYIEYYGKSGKETLSAVTTSQISGLSDAIETFASALNASLSSSLMAIWSAASSSDSYPSEGIDLVDFAERVKSAMPGTAVAIAADQVTSALAAAVIREEHGALHANAHGLAIYFPGSAYDFDSSYPTALEFTAATSWDEFLVTFFNPSGGGEDVYEPDDEWQQATLIVPEESQTHSISDNGADVDWIYFDLSAVASITLQTSGPMGDTKMWLYNGTGVPNVSIAENDDYGGSLFATIHIDNLGVGRYYAKVTDFLQNDNIPQYNIMFTITSNQDPYEPDDSYTQAAVLLAGSSQTHSISGGGGDIDWVRFELNQISDVILEISGDYGDTQMWLYDSSGVPDTYLDYDDDSGTGYFSLIAHSGLSPGTYYVEIGEYRMNDEIPSYAISLSVSPTVQDIYEPDGSYTQAALIVPGVNQTHSISLGGADIDWVWFELQSPSDVVLETSGDHGDTQMWLYDSSGVPDTYLDYDDDSGIGYFSLITHLELSLGTYYVKIGEYRMNDEIPSYVISLAVSPAVQDIYEPDGTYQQAKDINIGESQLRRIGQGGEDLDWARFTLSAPSNVMIETWGPSGDTEVWLFNSSGVATENPVDHDDDSGVGRFSRIVANGLGVGVYYIKVGAYGHFEEIPQYWLNLSASMAGTPGAPTSLHLVPGNHQISLSWAAPRDEGGSPLLHYAIYRGTTPAALSPVAMPTDASYVDTGLTNGQIYYYQVSAVNSFGEGPTSDQQSATPSSGGGGVPGQVTGLKATPGDGRVTLSWSAPVGGAPTIRYEVHRAIGQGGMEVIATVTETSYVDSNVVNGQSYRYEVVAAGEYGSGEASPAVAATPAAAPPVGLPWGFILVIVAVAAVMILIISLAVARNRKRKALRPPSTPPNSPAGTGSYQTGPPPYVGPLPPSSKPATRTPSLCPNCGAPAEGMAFCGYCGMKLR